MHSIDELRHKIIKRLRLIEQHSLGDIVYDIETHLIMKDMNCPEDWKWVAYVVVDSDWGRERALIYIEYEDFDGLGSLVKARLGNSERRVLSKLYVDLKKRKLNKR